MTQSKQFYSNGALDIEALLQSVQEGTLPVPEAKTILKSVEDLGFAQLDLHREKRIGFPEVVFGENKDRDQLITIIQTLMQKNSRVLATRVDVDKGEAILQEIPQATYHSIARCVTWEKQESEREVCEGYICVICAGTSDLFVAEEAALTVEHMGSKALRINDIGVAGMHRLMNHMETIRQANAVVVVAGMEGALPSVVGGLVGKPIIAVPTSVGYGASFNGIAALLGMLNSCAPGVTVVNIDNGFGAGYFAALLNKNMHQKRGSTP